MSVIRLVPGLAALAPDQFPHVRAERTTATFQLEARGNSTVVRLTQTGWKSGDEWTRAYEYLLAGNAQGLGGFYNLNNRTGAFRNASRLIVEGATPGLIARIRAINRKDASMVTFVIFMDAFRFVG